MANKLARKKIGESTQKYLDISEIKEGAVVLKDGTLRGVLLVSSVNFALKSEDEQNALIAGYIDFLNGFDYPIQVVIQSRKLNIDKYLRQLQELQKTQKNELLKIQMQSYQEYVRELVELGEIMTKKFFIIVPYSPYTDKKRNWFSKMAAAFSPGEVIKLSKQNFEKYKRELDIRMNQVQSSLNSLGLNAVILDTQSLIELYYNVYNISSAANQPLEDINQLQVEQEF